MSTSDVATTQRPLQDGTLRLSQLSTAVLFLLLTAWTAVMVSTHLLRSGVHWAGARVPIEAAALVLLVLVCTLAYTRYSISAWHSALFTSLAFMALTLNQFVFGVLIDPNREGLMGQRTLFFLTAGRLLAGLLLFLASWYQSFESSRRRPAASFLLGSADVALILLIADATLWAFRDRLPHLVNGSFNPTLPGIHLQSLTTVDYVLGIAGTFVFLAATLSYLASLRIRGFDLPWLPPAMLLAAFCQLHYMFFPIISRDRISTADALWVAFSLVLLIGLVSELRTGYQAERRRAQDLAVSYETERRRVAELEQLDRARAELFNILTHELLHPVAAIRGMAVTLARRWQAMDEDARLRMVDHMDQESRRLREMAEAAVTATSLEDAGFSLVTREEKPAELVRDAATTEALQLDGRLRVYVDPQAGSSRVIADRARIQQVLRNLLSNAEKYSDPGTPIRLEVRAEDGVVKFTVANRGPGIAAEDMARLFQRFSRIWSRGSDHITGSGLGLYIARMIVERHGGRIWIESVPGQETAASFTLPVIV